MLTSLFYICDIVYLEKSRIVLRLFCAELDIESVTRMVENNALKDI